MVTVLVNQDDVEAGADLGVFVGGVVGGDGVDDLARRGRVLNSIEEADELLMSVSLHATAEHGAVEDVQRREQRRGAVTLVVMGHGAAFAGLERQAALGPVKGLDLGLLVDRQHDRMGRRVHVEAGDVFELPKITITQKKHGDAN